MQPHGLVQRYISNTPPPLLSPERLIAASGKSEVVELAGPQYYDGICLVRVLLDLGNNPDVVLDDYSDSNPIVAPLDWAITLWYSNA